MSAGGLPRPKYFAPDLLQGLVREDMATYLQTVGRVPCQCQVCQGGRTALDLKRVGWEWNFLSPKFFPPPAAGKRTFPSGAQQEALRSHFLLAEENQIERFEQAKPERIAADLRTRYEEIHKTNPPLARHQAVHLRRWAEALEYQPN